MHSLRCRTTYLCIALCVGMLAAVPFTRGAADYTYSNDIQHHQVVYYVVNLNQGDVLTVDGVTDFNSTIQLLLFDIAPLESAIYDNGSYKSWILNQVNQTDMSSTSHTSLSFTANKAESYYIEFVQQANQADTLHVTSNQVLNPYNLPILNVEIRHHQVVYYLVALNQTDVLHVNCSTYFNSTIHLLLFDTRPTEDAIYDNGTYKSWVLDQATVTDIDSAPNATFTFTANATKIYYIEFIQQDEKTDFLLVSSNQSLTRYYIPFIAGYPELILLGVVIITVSITWRIRRRQFLTVTEIQNG